MSHGASTPEKIWEDGKKALGFFNFPTEVAKAGVMTLAGESPLPKIRKAAAENILDLAAFPFRIAKHLTVGFLKTTASLAWNAIKLAPILPAWHSESDRQTQLTHQQLVALGKDLPTPMPLTSPHETLQKQAA